MKNSFLTGAAIFACMTSVALAQTAPATPPKADASPAATATQSVATAAAPEATDATPTTGTSIRRQLTANLQQAGFTDVKVIPESFIVQAKDKSGNPVTMLLDADSMTVFTRSDVSGAAAQNSPDASGQKDIAGAGPNSGGMFTVIPARDDLTSQMIGLDIYNNEKQNIGAIKDIAFGHDGVKAYILGVGGFLGMGDHYVAVRPSAIKLTYDPTDKKWHAEMNTTADQLKAAPEYKYAS